MSAEKNEKLYEFGKFRFDAGEKTLRQDGKNVSLPPKVLEILCLLIERQGKIVTKDEIMSTVWADSFVEESNLKQSIYTQIAPCVDVLQIQILFAHKGKGFSIRRNYRRSNVS